MSRKVVAVAEAKFKRRDPLLLELVAAIGAGNIELGPIHSEDEFVYGWMDTKNGRIRLNPAPHAVLIALHEATHRVRPSWSERSVWRRSRQIMKQLSDDEIDRLYDVILSTACVKKRADTL